MLLPRTVHRANDRSVIVRCINKFLAVSSPDVLVVPPPVPDAQDWYANLRWCSGCKCLLLTHSATQFSFLGE